MKNISHKLCKFIIVKYIKKDINWPREVKIAQKLVRKFNNAKFWINLKDLKSSPPSLAWFLKPEGKAFLLKEYENFNINLNKKIIYLNDNKIGEDKKVCQKPKTVLEFIRYGKKT